MNGTKAELTFEGLDNNNYYPVNASNYDGYEGFNFADVNLLTANAIHFLGYGFETGYSNVLQGTTCAFTLDNVFGLGSGFGALTSSYAGETFNLKSGTFASAWCGSQPTYFEAINSKGHVKATAEFHLGQSATTIDFAKYGNDFKHVSAVWIVSEPGTYGVQGYKGYQIAMDNLYIHWNGSIPGSHHAHRHAPAAHMNWPEAVGVQAASSSHGHGDMATDHGAPYHSVIASLGGTLGHDGGGGLVAEFSLPPVEHLFGA